jgi:hypothetical protein
MLIDKALFLTLPQPLQFIAIDGSHRKRFHGLALVGRRIQKCSAQIANDFAGGVCTGGASQAVTRMRAGPAQI